MSLRGRPLAVDLERQRLPLAVQPVNAALQADPVDLEPVPQPGLGDLVAGVELAGQPVEVVEHLGVERPDVGRHDAAEQDAAEPRGRRDGQVAVAERQASGRRDRPGVEDLQLGENHRRSLLRRCFGAGRTVTRTGAAPPAPLVRSP